MPERVTIDTTVVIDYLGPEQGRHALARELFDLARRGEVELATAPQGERLERRGERSEQIREALSRAGIVEARQVARVSEATFLPFVVGHYVPGFAKATEGSSVSPADRFHVETHIADGRDLFITDDAKLLSLCARLREQGFPIVAMRLGDYLARRRGDDERPCRSPWQ